MRLTKEKLLAAWRIRKQIILDPQNEQIVNRYHAIKHIFDTLAQSTLSFDDEKKCYVFNGLDVVFNNGTSPSLTYFSCKDDDMTAGEAFKGLEIMCGNFPQEFHETIINLGCVLGGFTFTEHRMRDEFRIISNTITGAYDSGSLNSAGQTRHPSSHFADNNYFFNVISTVSAIRNNQFRTEDSKLVLRWPNHTYYSDDNQAEKSQKETLKYRFPYKFFYMWTHDVLHPVSLMAYRNLVRQEDTYMQYPLDKEMNQDFYGFIGENGWTKYSNAIRSFIPQDEQGDDFWEEMSQLLSVIMIQDQQMKSIKDLLETGNKAIILFGPPGTGKTYHAKQIVCQELGVGEKELASVEFVDSMCEYPNGCWSIIQFHPNYTYEDFIGGISPCLDGGQLSYTLKTGIFKSICDTANLYANKNKKFLVIIDEINRADLSSVFGELMYALEYRNEYITLPNFKEKFTIPSNVYIIGTMNSIDKSLVTFDLALRRRFGFYKIMPQLSALDSMLAQYAIDDACLNTYIARCKDLNAHIANPNSRLQLGPDYQIGHAYFGKIKDFLTVANADSDFSQKITSFDLERLWMYHLEPLIEEYLGNRIDDEEVKNCIQERKAEFIKPLE